MSIPNRSLVERAAEVYDFNSGLRVDPELDALPPPRRRPVSAAKTPPRERLAELPPQVEPPAGSAPADDRPQSEAAPLPTPGAVAPLRPAQAQPRASRAAAAAPAAANPIRHARAAIDTAALARAGFLLPDAPASGLAEEMRLVKRRLLATVDDRAARDDQRNRVILVASAQPGDGKTFLAINLALSICSESDRTVLLIDGDTAKPDLPARLGIDTGPGLVDALVDRTLDPETLVVETDVPGLAILSAGKAERNIPELLASARTEAVLARLLAADPRRVVMIDSPPALAASSAAVLAGHAGQTLVVVRADHTAEADLKEAVQLLAGAAGAGQLSLVLNQIAFAVGGRRYGKYEEYR